MTQKQLPDKTNLKTMLFATFQIYNWIFSINVQSIRDTKIVTKLPEAGAATFHQIFE